MGKIYVSKEQYPYASWILNWLKNRTKQLSKNIQEYRSSFYQNKYPISNNPSQEINRQLTNLSKVKLIKKKPKEDYFKAVYYPELKEIHYIDPRDLIHEDTHTLRGDYLYTPQEYVIDKNKGIYNESYWDQDVEIYARLMQFRKDNNINPNQIWTKQQIQDLRKNNNIKDYDLLNRYDDDFLLFLFNDIAQNNQQNNQDLFYAKNGNKLISKKKWIK